MPTLLPTVWTAVNPAVPYVWSCSECRAVFDMGPVQVSPGQKQIDQVNLQFEAHCKHVHAGSLPINHLGNTPSPGPSLLGTGEQPSEYRKVLYQGTSSLVPQPPPKDF